MQIFRKILQTILILLLIGVYGLSTTNPVNSASATVENYAIDIELKRDDNANVKIAIDIENIDRKNVITGKNIVLPFNNIINLNATINGQPVGYELDNEREGFSSVSIDFGGQAIRPFQKVKLVLNFDALKAVKSRAGVRTFLFYNNNFNSRNQGNISIIYPKDYGDLSFISARQLDPTNQGSDKTKLVVSDRSSLMMIWGNEYLIEIGSKFEFKQSDNQNGYYLLELIHNSPTQDVSYSSFKGADLGSHDELGNTFAMIKLDQKKQFEYRALIKKNSSPLDSSSFKTFKFTLDSSTPYGERVVSEITKRVNDLDKLELVNDFLVNNSVLSQTQKFSPNTAELSNFWQFMSDSKQMTSFEYCYALISAAEFLGHQGRFSYGYVLLGSNKTLTPHVWCELKVDDKVVLADPYLDKLTGLKYFGVESDLDRVKFGIWEPERQYLNGMGLFTENSFIQEATILDNLSEPAESQAVNLLLEAPAKIASGLTYNLKLTFNNKSSSFIPVKDILINNNSQLGKMNFSDVLKPALLPQTENVFEITDIREYNIFKNGLNTLNIEAELDDSYYPKLSTQRQVDYYLDDKAIILGLIVTNLVLFVAVFTIWKIFTKRSYYY